MLWPKPRFSEGKNPQNLSKDRYMNNSWEFTLFSWQEPRKLDHRLAVLIVFMILRVHGSYFMIFPQLFEKFFHNKVIIYNTRNQSNDTKKVRKKKIPVLIVIFSTVSQKLWIKMVYISWIRCINKDSCRFGPIYWRNPERNTLVLVHHIFRGRHYALPPLENHVGVYASSIFAKKCRLKLVNILNLVKRILW